MQSRLFLADKHLLETKCTKCGKYLSVPPIIIESNKPVCGRCVQHFGNLLENRAYFYENIAKLMSFPCVNEVHGCPVQSPWGTVFAHEINCQFRTKVCPAIDCTEEIINDSLVDHFKMKHNHLILAKSEYDLSDKADQNAFINKLITWKGQPFIVQIKTESKDIFLRISTFEEHMINNVGLKLIINSQQSSDSVCFNEFKIMKYESKYPTFSSNEKIKVSLLRNILGSEPRCVFNLEEISKPHNTDSNNDTLLSELECPVCTEYMTPPIYMCLTGHSICQKCKAKLSTCPSCSGNFSKSRNFTLERISEFVVYPCIHKDQGCDFTGNLKNINQHNTACSISHEKKVNCFIDDVITCNWKGFYNEFYQHLNEQHDTYCADLRYPLIIDIRYYTIVILKYDNKVFKVSVYWDATEIEQSHWAVMCIRNTEEVVDRYMFHLEFVNDKKIFTINEVCEIISATDTNHNCTKYINIPFNLLEPFVKDDQLTFKLNLVKLN